VERVNGRGEVGRELGAGRADREVERDLVTRRLVQLVVQELRESIGRLQAERHVN
jgi:hypothetical protein